MVRIRGLAERSCKAVASSVQQTVKNIREERREGERGGKEERTTQRHEEKQRRRWREEDKGGADTEQVVGAETEMKGLNKED